MKKIITLIFCILSISSIFAEWNYPVERYPRLYLPADVERSVAETAKKACIEVAPDYDVSAATPVLFNVSYPIHPHLKGKRIATVFFMNDTTEYKIIGFVKENDKMVEVKKPKAVLHVLVNLDTMEPLGIFNYMGQLFLPSYEEFRKNNPDYRLEKREPRKNNSITLDEATREGKDFYMELH